MKKAWLFILVILFGIQGYAQVGDRFNFLKESEAENYAKPLATTLGTALHSGTYHSADIPDLFGFSISFKGMFIFVPDDQTSFTPNLPQGYTAKEKTATIYGDRGGAYAGPNGYITYPPGINETSIPFVMPQITASLLGTEVLLRFVPKISVGERDIDFLGIGVRHKISRYIPLVPLDFAAQILYHRFTITDLVESKNLAFNVHASKTFGIVTAYGGLQLESSSIDLEYSIKGDPDSGDPELQKDKDVKLSLDGKNKFRFTLGAAAKLGFFVLNADLNLGSQTVAGFGLSFEF